MKNTIIIMLMLCGIVSSHAQVPTQMFEKGKAFEKHYKFKISRDNAPEKKMPVFDVA